MAAIDERPLILTLQMDEPSFARLDAVRRAHFPAARNVIPAHLTLFHNLPGGQLPAIAARLREVTRDEPPMKLRAAGLRFLGRGVAYAVDGDELVELRTRLARGWSGWLTPQDCQGFRPHVTIQNKVLPETARALHAALAREFTPFDVTGTGLLLWRYGGGPWEAAGTFPFGAALSQRSFSAEPAPPCD